MKYNKAIINYDSDGKFVSSEYETNIGTIAVTNEKQNDVHLEVFAKQEEITAEELLKRSDLVQINKEVKEKTAYKSDDILSDDDWEKISSKAKKSKKSKGWIKKLIATVTAIVVLGTGAYHLDKHKNIFGGKIYAIFHPDKKIETTINKNNSSNTTNNNTNKNNNSSGSSNSNENNKQKDYNERMNEASKREQQTTQVISGLATETSTNFSDEEIMEALNDKLLIANASLFEVSEYVNGRELSGQPYYYSFETLFPQGSNEYVGVKVFSQMRNEIIKSAYSKQSTNDIKELMHSYNEMYRDFVVYGNECTFEIDGKKYTLNYDELSPIAQLSLVELGDAIAVYTNDQKSISYNEEERNDLIRLILGSNKRK